MRVALVHDWLTGMRGGEKCLEVFCELFPDADVYTLVYLPDRVSPLIRSMKIYASWFNRLPGVKRYYRYGLPLFPRMVEGFALRDYDLILSSSHCVAKGILPNRAFHVSYLHSPMRYVWDMHDSYFGPDASWAARAGMALCRGYLQRWDVRSARRVDDFIATSNHIAGKIKNLYGRQAVVIPPPVDTEKFYISDVREPFYLIVSALVPYKNIQLAIDAFNKLGLRLTVAGEGPLRTLLETKAGPNIEFLGWVDDAKLAKLYASCQALIFPGEEDFGIVPLEAQASGRPVIAYRKGGATETVIGIDDPDAGMAAALSPTGVFFSEPTAASLIAVVERFQKVSHVFEPEALRRQAARFSRSVFKLRMQNFIDEKLSERSIKRDAQTP
jgi:glycosyltransferase involved in cell wall biosynthesis